MDILSQFIAYAGDFEKTLVDDDWQRLRRYFQADAVYEVEGVGLACRLEGPDAIFAGIKKSLDGFDRRFDGRKIAVESGPEVEGEALRMSWVVTYEMAGKAPFALRGRSEARYRDGRIAHLCDRYEPEVAEEFARWQAENGVELDASYV